MNCSTRDTILKIAALGWGSLIWDSRRLPVVGDWNIDGPQLPLEFARESADGRMTLVIVDVPATVPVLWAHLSVENLDQAVSALAEREGVPNPNVIGRWPNETPHLYSYGGPIGRWTKAKNLDGVVWTALAPGMRSKRGVAPDMREVKRHLESLDDAARTKAREYISKAPSQIKTNYREELEEFLLTREPKRKY